MVVEPVVTSSTSESVPTVTVTLNASDLIWYGYVVIKTIDVLPNNINAVNLASSCHVNSSFVESKTCWPMTRRQRLLHHRELPILQYLMCARTTNQTMRLAQRRIYLNLGIMPVYRERTNDVINISSVGTMLARYLIMA